MTLDQIQRVFDAAGAPSHVKVYLAGGATIVGQSAGSFDDEVLGIITHSGVVSIDIAYIAAIEMLTRSTRLANDEEYEAPDWMETFTGNQSG
jgi:hypothetical protein